MPTAQTKKQDATEPNTALQNGVDDVWTRDLAALLSNLESSGAFQRFVQIDGENQTLKKKLAKLETTNETNMETIALRSEGWNAEKQGFLKTLQEEKDLVDSLRAEKVNADELSSKIDEQERLFLEQVEISKKKDAECTRLQKVCQQKACDLDEQESMNAALTNKLRTSQDELSRTTEELKAANASLASVRSFIVQLQPMTKLRGHMYVSLSN